jgi:cobalt-zinc-cadmium efflux system membrane fusion protein
MRQHLFAAAALVAALLAAIPPLHAHGGEDHSAPIAAAAPSVRQPGFGADGTVFQIVLAPQAGGTTLVYLADMDSNAPVAGASLDVEAAGWQGRAEPSASEGIYLLAWAPPEAGADVTVMASAAGKDDLLLVAGVTPPAPPAVAARPDETNHWLHWGGGVAIGVLIAVAMLLGRNRRKAAIAALLVLLAAPDSFAHSGHDHGAAAPQAPAPEPGAMLVMPKATQFLLGIRTELVAAREAADALRVLGRVVPDPAGYARVQPSQPARVVGDPSFPLPIPGQIVKRGQVIAVLEPTLSMLERSDKRSALYRVESEIALAERELARQELLGAVVTVKAIETTRIRLDQLRREKAQIAGTALGRDLVSAPVDGIVTDVHVVPGEVVVPEKVMVEIVDPSRLRIEAVVHDLAAAGQISGATAATKLIPDMAFPLVLLGVSPRVDPIDQGIHAVFAVASDQARRLKVGLPVDVYLATGAARLRVAVPREALAELGGRQVVFVRTAPETFEARPVRVLRLVGPLAELDGLTPGERVVVQGTDQLKAAR